MNDSSVSIMRSCGYEYIELHCNLVDLCFGNAAFTWSQVRSFIYFSWRTRNGVYDSVYKLGICTVMYLNYNVEI